ncbi:N-acetylglucosamine kinase [Chondrinema litorale]|uniref:N-acetylglucosamine kinase n=1 Tax=Chondrinema litorale TaxID=2994555 RepID=UPI002542C86E|nr:N-acetylglucosamine kinase [Chondrinema litorale]UZR95510.1 N-acetylglucosamine kinase [Chondrinema litorale]
MILIADSGSSKTDWRLIDNTGKISQQKSLGLNPYYQSLEEIHQNISATFNTSVLEQVNKVFFYGAGCKEDGKVLMENALKNACNLADIWVGNDLLAAARATCGKELGIACILGTGANSCLYNGEEIIDHIPPLGFILGDEGSGAFLGRELINAFFKRDLPQDLQDRFQKRYNLTEKFVLENVYKKEFPNRFLAKFTRFLHHNISHPYVKQLLYDSFQQFFVKNVKKYKGYQEYPVHFTGSIAFYFNDILRYTASELNITLGKVIESPIAGLSLFHEKDI